MKVKLIRNTYSPENGGDLKFNQEINVDIKTGTRWVTNKIAVQCDKLDLTKAVDVDVVEDLRTNAELLDECLEKGLNPAKGKAKKYYLDLLKEV